MGMNFVDAVRLALEGKKVVRKGKRKINNAFEIITLHVADATNSNFSSVSFSWEVEGWEKRENHDFYSLSLDDFLSEDYEVVE